MYYVCHMKCTCTIQILDVAAKSLRVISTSDGNHPLAIKCVTTAAKTRHQRRLTSSNIWLLSGKYLNEPKNNKCAWQVALLLETSYMIWFDLIIWFVCILFQLKNWSMLGRTLDKFHCVYLILRKRQNYPVTSANQFWLICYSRATLKKISTSRLTAPSVTFSSV